MNFKLPLATGAVLVGLAVPAMAQTLSIKVDGADIKDVLRSASLVATIIDNEEDASTQDIIAAARADYRRILTGLYSEGYYAGTVSILIDGQEASNVAPLDAPDTIEKVRFNITTGPAFRFGTADIAPITDATELPDTFASGERARSGAIGDAASAAISGWRDAGHPVAAVSDQQITARHADRIINATIGIDPGPNAVFGPLTVSGNDAVRERAIRRIIGYPEGAEYSPQTLEQVAERLRRTGAFSSVAMVESDTVIDGQLPVEIEVAEAAPRRVGFGLDLSTVDGLTVSGYWMHRNFLGGAQRFRVEGEVSGIAGETGGIDYSTGVSLSVPRPFAIDTELTASLALSHEDEPDYLIDQLSGDVTVTRLLENDTDYSVGIGFVTARSEDASGIRHYNMLTFPMTGTIDRRDDTLNPKTGQFSTLELTPFLGTGDVGSGGRAYFDGRIYRSVGEQQNVTFALRGQLGSVLGVNVNNAPPDYLFYSGGGDSVRGEGYKSLGVTQNGVTTGGLSFAAMSLETRVDITDTIGVVGFYDAGFVGETEIPFEDGDWQSGAGVGLRYYTGIGPIRLDLATAASGDNAGKSLSVYVGIGQAF